MGEIDRIRDRLRRSPEGEAGHGPAPEDTRRRAEEGVSVSAVRESDVPGLVETAALSWRHGFSNFLSPAEIEQYLETSFSAEAFRRRLADPTQEWVLARDAGEVVGFASFGDRGMGPELLLLYVRPSHWRRGVGRRLLAFLEEHARRLGVVRYRALAHRRNERGVAFYEGQGFSKEDAPDRHDHWAMVKPLGLGSASPSPAQGGTMVWEMAHEDYDKADGTQGGVPMKRLSTEA